MNLKGSLFKPGAAVVQDTGYEDTDMQIAIIDKIFVINGDSVVFKTKVHQIKSYIKHYRAHILTLSRKEVFIKYNNLPLHMPIHPRKCRVLPRDTIVILPFYII